MVATLWLLGCALVTGQAPDRDYRPAAPRGGEWLLTPHLGRCQEVLYQGSYKEEALDGSVQFSRAYAVEARVFVLATPPRGFDVAFLTVLKDLDQRPGVVPAVSGGTAPSSVRLERARVDLQGRVTADPGVSLAVPLEGPPSVECGAFVELPGGRIGTGQTWAASEDGRPARDWQLVGSEMVQGTSCLKFVGVQKSEDWDQPRGDHAAWRRVDTVWVAPRLGIAYRVERVIERREPAHSRPTHRGVLRYDYRYDRQPPGTIGDAFRDDILRALSFRQSAAPLLAAPNRYGPQLNALLARVNYHLEHQGPTPYREAVLQLQRRLEAARRGEAPPPPLPEETPRATPAAAAVGRPAPDFIASNLVGPGTVRLRQWLGRPVLLVFYNPAVPPGERLRVQMLGEVLRFAQQLHADYEGRVAVLGLSVSDDVPRVRSQRDFYRLTFPLLSGCGLRTSYAVRTPKFVVIDSAGFVRGTCDGWGPEVPDMVRAQVKRCLASTPMGSGR